MIVALLVLRSAPVCAADPMPLRAGLDPFPPPTVRLEYERGPGAQRCPGEQAFRDAIGAKVARDLFAAVPKPSVRLVVSLRRRGGGYEGTAELRDAAGAVTWSMLFPPPSHRPSSTCSNVILALAFGVSLVVDPVELPTADPPLPLPAPPPVVAVPSPTIDPPPPVAPFPKRPTMDPFLFVIGLGSTVGFGIAPRPAVGVTADVGFQWKVDAAPLEGVSLALGVRWDPPASGPPLAEFSGGRVVSSRVLGSVAPCGHWWKLYGCAVGEVGQLRAHAEDFEGPAQGTYTHGAIGGRLGVEVPFAPHLGFRASGEVLGTLSPVLIRIFNRPGWAQPDISGGVRAGLYVFF